MTDGTAEARRFRRKHVWLLAVALSSSITLTNQMWVGDQTIYADENVAKRERLHHAILTNRLPDGVQSWDSIGANGINIRVLTIWAAEGLHRLTGQSLDRCYRVIETAALFACCLLLVAFLQSCAGPTFALIGLLYFGAILPLTYMLHYFHPWDKPSLAAWLAALICAHQRRWVALGAVLTVAMFIKFDIMLFPLLFASLELQRGDKRSALLIGGALFAVTLTTYALLRWIAPGGLEPSDMGALLVNNIRDLRENAFRYPPLLGLGVPVVLAALGYRAADRFAKAAVHLAIVQTGVLLVRTNFIEIRAEMPVFVLLLPAAAYGLYRILGADLMPSPALAGVAPRGDDHLDV